MLPSSCPEPPARVAARPLAARRAGGGSGSAIAGEPMHPVVAATDVLLLGSANAGAGWRVVADDPAVDPAVDETRIVIDASTRGKDGRS